MRIRDALRNVRICNKEITTPAGSWGSINCTTRGMMLDTRRRTVDGYTRS